MDQQTWLTVGSAIGSAVAGGVGGVLWLRRQLSHDKVQESRDTKERDIMSDLMHERDVAASEATKLRSDLVTCMQKQVQAEMSFRLMEGDYRNLMMRYERSTARNQRLADRLVKAGLLDPADMEFLVTRFSNLDELPPEKGKK